MKKVLNILFSSLIVFSMCACQVATRADQSSDNTTDTSETQKSFSEYLDEYVAYVLTSDFTTLQQLVENPENYGINRDEVDVNLGKITSTEEDVKKNQELLDELQTYTVDELSETEQVIYYQLESDFKLKAEMMDSKFDYTGNIWGSMSGVHENLVSYFSEYAVKSEKDIEDLITLINDVPRYVNDALEYTEKQAENNTLCFDYDTVITNIQEIIDSKETSSIYKELNDEIEALGLSDKETKDYEEQVKEALVENFFPSYETMKEKLTSLKSKVKQLTGLSNIENGKEYYELLVKNSTGSNETIEEIKKNLENAAADIEEDFTNLLYEDFMAYYEMDSISTGYSNIEDILPALKESIAADFPKVEKLDYELNALNDDQSTEGVVAYCMVPALDATIPTQIRYNKRDYGENVDSLDIYTTLAHEGIPGHMYQFTYVLENMEHPVQYLLSNIGYTEGYATYVQFYALNYLDSSNAIKLYKYNDIYTYMYVCLMDIDIHYNGMSLKQFTNKYSELFGSDLTDLYNQLCDNPSTFLSYYYGYLQVMNLRAYAKEELGNKYTDLGFNEALLRYGAVNFDLVKQSIDHYIEETK